MNTSHGCDGIRRESDEGVVRQAWCQPRFGVGIRMAQLNDSSVKVGLQGDEECEKEKQD